MKGQKVTLCSLSLYVIQQWYNITCPCELITCVFNVTDRNFSVEAPCLVSVNKFSSQFIMFFFSPLETFMVVLFLYLGLREKS